MHRKGEKCLTVSEIKRLVMFQTNNDAEDLGDFQPFLMDYINEGYDLAAMAYAGQHVTEESEQFPRLRHDRSVPELPVWLHRAIADWATWLVYRNGNSGRQKRGLPFRQTAQELLAAARASENGRQTAAYIRHIPR